MTLLVICGKFPLKMSKLLEQDVFLKAERVLLVIVVTDADWLGNQLFCHLLTDIIPSSLAAAVQKASGTTYGVRAVVSSYLR